MTTFKDILALLAILACYGIAGHFDYEDALRNEAQHGATASDRNTCAPSIVESRHGARIGDENRRSPMLRAGACDTSTP